MMFVAVQTILVVTQLTHVLADPYKHPQGLPGDALLSGLEEVDGEEGQQVVQWMDARDFYQDEPAVSDYAEEEDLDMEETFANIEEMEEMEPEASEPWSLGGYEEDGFDEVMPVVAEDFVKEHVHQEHHVDDVEVDEAIDIGEELFEVFGDQEEARSGPVNVDEETEEEYVTLKDVEYEEEDIDAMEDVSRESSVGMWNDGVWTEHNEEEEDKLVAEELTHAEHPSDEVREEDGDLAQTCWGYETGTVSCLNLDPDSAMDRMVLVMLKHRFNMHSKCKACPSPDEATPSYM